VPSDATTQSRRAIRGNPKNEIARSGGPKPETLQSQIDDQSRIRISINTLDVLHRRRGRAGNVAATKSANRTVRRSIGSALKVAWSCVKSIGWGTWIRTKINGVRVRRSTVELFPKRQFFFKYMAEWLDWIRLTIGSPKAIINRAMNWPDDDREKFARFVSELETWRDADKFKLSAR
jgi:hypothetical protein